MQHKTYVMSW